MAAHPLQLHKCAAKAILTFDYLMIWADRLQAMTMDVVLAAIALGLYGLPLPSTLSRIPNARYLLSDRGASEVLGARVPSRFLALEYHVLEHLLAMATTLLLPILFHQARVLPLVGHAMLVLPTHLQPLEVEAVSLVPRLVHHLLDLHLAPAMSALHPLEVALVFNALLNHLLEVTAIISPIPSWPQVACACAMPASQIFNLMWGVLEPVLQHASIHQLAC